MTPTLSRSCPEGVLTLRPLRREDGPALRAIVDEEMWRGNSQPLPATDADMSALLGTLVDASDVLAFAVELNGRVVGRTTLYDAVPGLKVEIGNTIYARDVWGGGVNPAAKLLLMEHAFTPQEAGGLGVQRVALRCDHRNTRSHRAIARLGAHFEGTLRRFRPAADGTVADVDYFSVLVEEWPSVRAGLLARVEP